MQGTDKKKRVLFRGMRLSGGAPRSVYQYLKILKDDGCEVSVFVQPSDKALGKQYAETFDRVTDAKDVNVLFSEKKFVQMYRLLSAEYRMLKKERPDTVFLLGYINGYFYGRMCNRLGIPNVLIIAGGDLNGGRYLLKGFLCDHIICFSEENKNVLKDYYDENRITVISNRIALKTVFDDVRQHYDFSDKKEIRILLTSRLDNDKIHSVTNFIKLLSDAANESRRFTLAVAGGGAMLENLQAFAESISNPYLKIELLGHVENMEAEFKKAHVAVGKARSVIEPVMMNRIGWVINDEGKLQDCSCENFEKLYSYNFSGRNPEPSDSQAIVSQTADLLLEGKFDLQQIYGTAEKVRLYYSSEYLKEKLYAVLGGMKPFEKRVGHLRLLYAVLVFTKRKLCNKISLMRRGR